MATCRDVITRALRTAGIVPLSEDPEASEADYGLDALQSLFDTWVTGGMFGRLTDVYKDAAYTAKEGERVHTTGSPTITIPTTYAEDGDEGSDRAPYDLSLIEVQDGSTRNAWLYDRSSWVDLKGLALGDDCPLAERGVHGLACALAEHLVSPFGTELSASAQKAAFTFKHAISYKLGSTRPGRSAEYF